jgi:hypothetical protein
LTRLNRRGDPDASTNLGRPIIQAGSSVEA